MTCSNNTCGTGLGTVVLPSDPDNVVFINAAGTFGGADITWSYPTVNPHAVSYVILYRGTSLSFAGSVEIAKVGGTHYYDKIEVTHDTTFYYWIKIVSVNGTVGAVIGPASAVVRPLIDQIIENLANQIHEGTLAQSLSEKIASIGTLHTNLANEIQDRLDQAGVITTLVNTLQATADETVAAVDQFNIAMADNNDAFATAIQTVQSSLNTDLASVQTTLQTNIDSVNDVLDAIYTVKVDVNGYVGGFGIHGTTTNVEAMFDVDTFAVGRYDPATATKKASYPFMINEEGEVLIKNALIQGLSADHIDTRGLSIKDLSGNVIFASGTALDWSRIGGNNKPADNATVGATIGTNLYGQMTENNISTFIAGASIGTALIKDAAITNAKVDNLNADKITAGVLSAGRIDVTKLIGSSTGDSTPGSNKTYVVPNGLTKLSIVIRGGGGAGGAGTEGLFTFSGFGYNGQNGGSGGLYILTVDVMPGQVITYSVGQGGIGVTNGKGNDGGSSSVTVAGVTYTSYGGIGGLRGDVWAYSDQVGVPAAISGLGGGSGSTGGANNRGTGGPALRKIIVNEGEMGVEANGPPRTDGGNGSVLFEVYQPNGLVSRDEWTGLINHMNERLTGYSWP